MKNLIIMLLACVLTNLTIFGNERDCSLSNKDIIAIGNFQEAKRTLPPGVHIPDEQIMRCAMGSGENIFGSTCIKFAGYNQWFPFFKNPTNSFKTVYYRYEYNNWKVMYKTVYANGTKKGILAIIFWVILEIILILWVRYDFFRFVTTDYQELFFDKYRFKNERFFKSPINYITSAILLGLLFILSHTFLTPHNNISLIFEKSGYSIFVVFVLAVCLELIIRLISWFKDQKLVSVNA
jgi:hypothetical protein